jgi:hypothetical protein
MMTRISLISKTILAWRTNVIRPASSRYITPYRLAVALGFIAVVFLALVFPVSLAEPDDWSYYFGVQNFIHGQFTIDNQTHLQESRVAIQHVGFPIQYWNIGDNKWALEKAPGVVFYLIPFQLMGIPRAGNIMLALGVIIITFLLLKRLRDEKAAMIGSLLMLFNPTSLLMLNRAYMDTFASQAFLAIGGGLYIYYHLERNRLGPLKKETLLLAAFFLLGWSVMTRYTNVLVSVVIVLHFIIIRIISLRKGQKEEIKFELLPFFLGIGLPAAALLLYDYCVFGSPWDYGYRHSPGDISFAFQFLGQVNQSGQSVPLHIIWENLKIMPRMLLAGFPLLIIGIPGLVVILYGKLGSLFQRVRSREKTYSANTELPWDILLILMGWFVCVFFLYLGYEWTADSAGGDFFHITRFYLPGLFPIAIISALFMGRFSFRFYLPILILLSAFGLIIYLQSVGYLHLLPRWLTNRGLLPRDRPGGFPRPNPGNMPGGNFPRPSPGRGYLPPSGR